MQLTILGASASYAEAGQACAGYLVEFEDVRVLVDCGNGTIANASAVTDVTKLDAVLVSHTHPDHFADIYALQAALRFAPEGPVGSLPIYVPEGLWDRMRSLLSARGAEQFAAAFEPHVIADGDRLAFGGITVTCHAVDHEGPTFGMTFDAGGLRLAYTADTRLGEAVRSAVAGADVLLAECTLPEEYAGKAPHMTATEAATLAKDSGAEMLILTHLWPTADHEAMADIAAGIFDGDLRLAEELMVVHMDADDEESS